MPLVTGVAQAGSGFGAFSTCTRHIRQLAAIESFCGSRNAENTNLRGIHHRAAVGHLRLLPSISISSMSLPCSLTVRIDFVTNLACQAGIL